TVTNFQAGEWLAYTVNVSSAGKYDLAVRAANGQAAGASLHIEIDGVNVSGTVPVPGTGGASTYRWFGKPDVSLTAGKHVIKVMADQQSFNMNAVSVLAAQAPASAPAAMTIEAENMALAGYVVENGNRIRLSDDTGTASQAFSGGAGTYKLPVFVLPESDGQSTLELYKGATLLQRYTYPLSDTPTSFMVNNVALNGGEML